jgi:hypothetical protein
MLPYPAGTFPCYRMEITLATTCGDELEDPVLDTVMWVNVDNYDEIKRVSYQNWEKTEIAEFVSGEWMEGVYPVDSLIGYQEFNG